MEIAISENVDETQWDYLVGKTPEGSFFQTTHYAGLWKELHSVKPLFLKAETNSETEALMLAIKGTVGLQLFEETGLKTILPVAQGLLPEIHCTYGPLCTGVKKKEAAIAILNGIIDYCKNNRVYSTEITPPIRGVPEMEIQECFTQAGFESVQTGTFLVDTTQKTGDLWNGLNKAAKKSVSDCQTQGVTVTKAANEDEVGEYLELLKEFRKNAGLLMPPLYPTKKFWSLRHGKNTEVYLARQNGKLVSGMGIFYFNGKITEVAVARDLKCKAYAQDAIKWEVIKWGSENGFNTYDLGGVNPNPKTEKDKGIYQFKAKWGGRLVTFKKYKKSFSTLRRKFIECIGVVKKKI